MSIEKPSLNTNSYFNEDETFFSNNSTLLPYLDEATNILNETFDRARSSTIAGIVIVASPTYADLRTNSANEGTVLQVPRSKRLTHE